MPLVGEGSPGEIAAALAFGPVPSRRLGHSLGISNVPPKTCSYSCVYCQVGRTPHGEPTLDLHLGEEIEGLRPLGLRIAVISNGSLVWREEVRSALARADWVSLKGDAVDHAFYVRRLDIGKTGSSPATES
jgi:wyosine [tRNA(Phe)-imidazoG37] synthetase (radical SAM superfamily)